MKSAEVSTPNILFILTDDQGPWAMGCAGNDEIRTPNLDRLAKTGVRFDSFFCASPVCSPARASIVTGRIPSAHGVHDWLRTGDTIAKYEPEGDGRLIEYLAGMPGYTDYLAAAGYTCAISGKWHLGDCHHPQKGFSFWEVHSKGGGPYYGAPMVHAGETYEEPRYVTDAITDTALGFLDSMGQMRREPFYLSVHYTAPHAPWNRENHPAERWDDYFENCRFDSVPSTEIPPEWVRKVQRFADTPERRRTMLSGYFAAVTAMDANVGRLLDWLETHNLREETLVVFMGDNGMCMGHHGVYGKGNGTRPLNMFEESVKVPFIVSQPGRVPEGVVCSEMLSQYDFMPTLLDYVGIENPQAEKLPGRSFVSLLMGKEEAGRDEVVVFDEYGPVRMVRTKDWKYVHRYPDGPNELYHLSVDPREMTNLVSDAGCASTIEEMLARLEGWFSRWADPIRDGRGCIVTGAGQGGLMGGPDGTTFYEYMPGELKEPPRV
ncbi:MAG: sulfatase-like hydrolase/transferase [Armatimonadetes bacterium]|nr:sulfatase-like hydrolase/transferase [Armatimonadota bacterium]